MKHKHPFKLFSLVLGMLLGSAFLCAGCAPKTPALPMRGTVENDMTLYPQPTVGYAGDPIPFFDGEKLNLYYIHDSRTFGLFHPWNLFQTADLCNWEDCGLAIAGEDKGAQDYGIGTGTVLRGHDGKYHAFYTGWNGYQTNVEFTEKVQHAVSDDLRNWTKRPEDGFYGGVDDFRDPHVVWVEAEQKYWMLVSTWAGPGNYKPALKWYKSTDLSRWEYCGIYFDDNDDGDFMECPTLLQYNGYWYLSWFQKAVDGTNARVTRYRYRKDLFSGDWIKPETDYFDGAGFSAARLVPFRDNRLLTVGWIGTKIADYDLGAFTWAGSLAVHELSQQPDGTLVAMPVPEVVQKLSTEVQYPAALTTEGVACDGNTITFAAGSGISYRLFEKLSPKTSKTTFTLQADEGIVGLTFARKPSFGYGELSLQLNLNTHRAEFYNMRPAQIIASSVSQAFSEFEQADSYECTMLWEGQCLTLYINNRIALSTRMYDMANRDFGFYSAGTAAKIQNLHFYQ